jgi:hypothetical protein
MKKIVYGYSKCLSIAKILSKINETMTFEMKNGSAVKMKLATYGTL